MIAEIGDKTQLATIALAAKFPASPVGILMGTTTGMVVADGFGIIVGVVLCKRIPERAVKVGAAVIFMLFGIVSSFQLFREELAMGLLPAGACILGVIAPTVVASLVIRRRSAATPVPTAIDAACEDRAGIAR